MLTKRETLPFHERPSFRIEEYEPANRACPQCGLRWVKPGESMAWIDVEACEPCAAVRRDADGNKIRINRKRVS